MILPDFVTHYFESDRGPFRNICDLSDAEMEPLIKAERNAVTAFNRFALGPEFFKIRRAADDLLIAKYTEKFGAAPEARPFFATLGTFDRTASMYREGASVQIKISDLKAHQLTFMYPDHFHLVWSSGMCKPDFQYAFRPFHELLFTRSELPCAIEKYGLDEQITRANPANLWQCAYIEAHIWDPTIGERYSRDHQLGG